jgi:hypothetical protein
MEVMLLGLRYWSTFSDSCGKGTRQGNAICDGYGGGSMGSLFSTRDVEVVGGWGWNKSVI